MPYFFFFAAQSALLAVYTSQREPVMSEGEAGENCIEKQSRQREEHSRNEWMAMTENQLQDDGKAALQRHSASSTFARS